MKRPWKTILGPTNPFWLTLVMYFSLAGITMVSGPMLSGDSSGPVTLVTDPQYMISALDLSQGQTLGLPSQTVALPGYDMATTGESIYCTCIVFLIVNYL